MHYTANAFREYADLYEQTDEYLHDLSNLNALGAICVSELAQTSPDRAIGLELRDGLIGPLHTFSATTRAALTAHGREHSCVRANRPKVCNAGDVTALIAARDAAEAEWLAANDAPGAGNNETPAELAAHKRMNDAVFALSEVRPTTPEAATLLLQFFVKEFGPSAFGSFADADRRMIENVIAGLSGALAASEAA